MIRFKLDSHSCTFILQPAVASINKNSPNLRIFSLIPLRRQLRVMTHVAYSNSKSEWIRRKKTPNWKSRDDFSLSSWISLHFRLSNFHYLLNKTAKRRKNASCSTWLFQLLFSTAFVKYSRGVCLILTLVIFNLFYKVFARHIRNKAFSVHNNKLMNCN